ncbi:IclR family transcriptional regulator [Pseudonocardia xinjiangensis]|uniref:IclR family transcriptional regulator n=1 Tax=Pseudonocardia xinjiangensis TaxID=75289 RepID=UPI003D93FF02
MPRIPGHQLSRYRERNSTADRALDVLAMFDDEHPVVSGVEAASRLGVARSTAYRYLQSLVRAHFLEEAPSGGYRLGMRFMDLGRLVRKVYDLSDIAAPVLADLAARTGETALITKRVGDLAVCLDLAESEVHRLRISYERGATLPLNAGASALVLLAWEDTESARRTLERLDLQPFTPATLTDVNELLGRLERIRSDGYAVARSELDDDVIGIAAPIFRAGTLVAAISVAAVASRVPRSRERRITEEVRGAATTISERLTLVEG